MEYEHRLSEIDRLLVQAQAVMPSNIDEAVALFSDIPQLWAEATVEERRKLIGPLIQRVYVDLERKQIAAIVPEPPFQILLAHAIQKAPEVPVLLVPMDELNHEPIWSWWRRGRVELYHEHGLGVLVIGADFNARRHSLATAGPLDFPKLALRQIRHDSYSLLPGSDMASSYPVRLRTD